MKLINLKYISIVFIFTFLSFIHKPLTIQKIQSFKIDMPDDWFEARNEQVNLNHKIYKLGYEQMNALTQYNSKSKQVYSYYKNTPVNYETILPSLQVTVWKNTGEDLHAFYQDVYLYTDNLKSIYERYDFIDKPQTIVIDSIESIYYSSKYVLKTKDGQFISGRSRVYRIPFKQLFYQISMNDTENDDCSELFDLLLASIQTDY